MWVLVEWGGRGGGLVGSASFEDMGDSGAWYDTDSVPWRATNLILHDVPFCPIASSLWSIRDRHGGLPTFPHKRRGLTSSPCPFRAQ